MEEKKLQYHFFEKVLYLMQKLFEKTLLFFKVFSDKAKNIKDLDKLVPLVKITGIISGIVLLLFFITPLLQELVVSFHQVKEVKSNSELTDKEISSRIKKLEITNASLYRKLSWKTPHQSYLVVNSTKNEFFLYRGTKLIREGICSTGSYIMLQATDERKWIFKTPRGVFNIQGKITSPVWRKPDWAFIEEGLPVPPENSYLRYESGVLGDYAMSLGHGYLIHGTLYQRFLGLPVTHGCIRLGDDDLKAVYNALDNGSKVFIY